MPFLVDSRLRLGAGLMEAPPLVHSCCYLGLLLHSNTLKSRCDGYEHCIARYYAVNGDGGG